MIMVDNHLPISTNRLAVISMISAILTLGSFCIAVTPIPFTGWICYPTAAVLGLVALLSGLISLRQIRSNGGNGRAYALLGIWMGGLTTLASLCALILGAVWLSVIANFIRHLSI
jgi:hypothetical protein